MTYRSGLAGEGCAPPRPARNMFWHNLPVLMTSRQEHYPSGPGGHEAPAENGVPTMDVYA